MSHQRTAHHNLLFSFQVLMNRNWRWLLPAYIWCLPMTLAGFVIATVFYKARDWVWHDGVLTCVAGVGPDGSTRIWGKPNAQTLGWIVIYDTHENRLLTDLRVHEHVHVGQAFVGGLFGLVLTPLIFLAFGWSPLLGLVLGGFVGGLGFAALYGILFLYLLKKQGAGWYEAYKANPFEVQAYALQDRFLENTNAKPWGV